MQRSIYTDKQLSVEKYIVERNQMKLTMQSKFVELKKNQLKKYLQPTKPRAFPSWILANDFVQFLYFIDDHDEDFLLLENLLEKFKLSDIQNLRNPNIGRILMKMLHHFKRDLTAQKVRMRFVFRMKST